MRALLLLMACVIGGRAALADEGIWTFDNFPAAAVNQAYGVDITPAWLDHVRLATVRLTNCSASFVSVEGLILTHTYPDATFILRLNFGTVQGWVENGVSMEPFTHLDRAFERATGDSPFRIPDRWMRAKTTLDMRTPFCICTSNDIVGGNSGSPLIDAGANIVGLIFDQQSRHRSTSGHHSRSTGEGLRRTSAAD